MKLQLIDTHCHLYLEEYRDDIKEVIRRAEMEGVSRFYLPAIDSETIDDLLKLELAFPEKCHAMMGLHPCSIKAGYKEELKQIEQWHIKRRFAAVGEIGLDYFWDQTYISEQSQAFQQQIEWALQYDLPIVVHSRDSLQDCIKIVRKNQSGNLKGVFHCFTGSYESAREIIDTGFYLGIGGVLTYKNSGLAAVMEKIELEHVVLETDAPYLTPVPFRGKRNESSYIKYVAQKLAEIKKISVEEVAATTTANAQKVFGS